MSVGERDEEAPVRDRHTVPDRRRVKLAFRNSVAGRSGGHPQNASHPAFIGFGQIVGGEDDGGSRDEKHVVRQHQGLAGDWDAAAPLLGSDGSRCLLLVLLLCGGSRFGKHPGEERVAVGPRIEVGGSPGRISPDLVESITVQDQNVAVRGPARGGDIVSNRRIDRVERPVVGKPTRALYGRSSPLTIRKKGDIRMDVFPG